MEGNSKFLWKHQANAVFLTANESKFVRQFFLSIRETFLWEVIAKLSFWIGWF
jgi:hypothetical protein